MKILIVTDAWPPQINGVARTLKTTVEILEADGHQIRVVNPSEFRTYPMPGYSEIRMAWMPYRKVSRILDEYAPEAIHISTEGPLGLAARRYCLKHGLKFTTAYHTRFPEYLRLRLPIPVSWSYRFIRRFHNSSSSTMVATQSLEEDLCSRGFTHIKRWGRGVDVDLFRPQNSNLIKGQKPIAVYLGRVAVEKNINAFLDLDIEAGKCVIGDGPSMAELRDQHPDVQFLGYKTGQDLADHLASADVMVFPSLTDTFGLVVLEAMACGVPVAAFPVTGPKDIIENGINGWTDRDLAYAVEHALKVEPEACRAFAEEHSWNHATGQFLFNLVPVNGVEGAELKLESQPG